jgi:hypothetical protein
MITNALILATTLTSIGSRPCCGTWGGNDVVSVGFRGHSLARATLKTPPSSENLPYAALVCPGIEHLAGKLRSLICSNRQRRRSAAFPERALLIRVELDQPI